MRKLCLMLLFSFCMIFSACNPDESKKDDIFINVKGSWELYQDTINQGIITFNDYESFEMNIKDKPVVYADIAILPSKSKIITISYVEDENGDEVTNGDDEWICELSAISEDKAYITNLPYFKDQKLLMIKK